jgi:hypothetical protein
LEARRFLGPRLARVLRQGEIAVLEPVSFVVIDVSAVLGRHVGARSVVLRVVHRERPTGQDLTHKFELQAAAFGVLRVPLDLVHHLGLRERERGFVRRQGSRVAECVPDVDDVALVEAGEPKLLQRDRVELGCGDEEPILEQGEFYAVVGRFARGDGTRSAIEVFFGSAGVM